MQYFFVGTLVERWDYSFAHGEYTCTVFLSRKVFLCVCLCVCVWGGGEVRGQRFSALHLNIGLFDVII